MAAPYVSDIVISYKPMVTWQGSQLWFKKWRIETKLSTHFLEIHKSKFIMQVSQDSRDCTMNFSFVFSTTFGKVFCIKVHLDGNLTQGLCFKINLPRNGNSTKDKGTNSFTINKLYLLQTIFYDDHPYSK
jgi:hypothetical protein